MDTCKIHDHDFSIWPNPGCGSKLYEKYTAAMRRALQLASDVEAPEFLEAEEEACKAWFRCLVEACGD